MRCCKSFIVSAVWSSATVSLKLIALVSSADNYYVGGGGGQEGGSPGVIGAGGLREAGEEGAGGGISKRGGSREKWEKFRNTGTIFRNRKSTRRREPLWKGQEPGVQGAGGGMFRPPVPPPHNKLRRGWNFTDDITNNQVCCKICYVNGKYLITL